MLLYALGAQSLLIAVVACAVPGGASFLTRAGFVTPGYESEPLTLRLMPIPATDPTVFVSAQSLVQMLVVALAIAGFAGLVKTNPWQHGALPNSTPPGRDSAASAPPAPPAPPASPAASVPSTAFAPPGAGTPTDTVAADSAGPAPVATATPSPPPPSPSPSPPPRRPTPPAGPAG